MREDFTGVSVSILQRKYSAFLGKGWGLGKGKPSFPAKRRFPLPQEHSPLTKKRDHLLCGVADGLGEDDHVSGGEVEEIFYFFTVEHSADYGGEVF